MGQEVGQDPFFSVIIPTYNRAELLPRAIESVQEQTFSSWELIIVDDGSTDNTAEVVRKYSGNLRYLQQERGEKSRARNKGLDHARGKYICFLDSDDYYLDNHLQVFNEIIREHPDLDGIFYSNTLVDNDGITRELEDMRREGRFSNLEYILINSIGAPRVCIPKAILGDERFDPAIDNGEDTELWNRILQSHSDLLCTDQFTVVFTQHQERSIYQNKIAVLKSNLRLKKLLVHQPDVSGKARSRILHDSYFRLANGYKENNQIWKMNLSLAKAFLISPFYRTREKIYLFVRSLPGIFKKKP